jgi:hypothetical protein
MSDPIADYDRSWNRLHGGPPERERSPSGKLRPPRRPKPHRGPMLRHTGPSVEDQIARVKQEQACIDATN